MRTLQRLRSWWRAFLHRQAMERGMSDELEFHIARHADHLTTTHGLSRDEALAALLNSERLSPASRAVLVLHFQEEMPLAEVAAVLDLPLGTVKSRLAYGLKALRQQIGDQRSL